MRPSQVPRFRGIRRAASSLKFEIKFALRHLSALPKTGKYRGQKNLRLHVGSGPNRKEGWVNIDPFAPSDLTLDMREPLPLDDESCSIVYSEHFFEHLDHPFDTTRFLRESFRVLEDGGKFSLGVPDTELALLAYAGVAHHNYFSIVEKGMHPVRCTTRAEHIDYHFRQDGDHRFAWDFETLRKVLAEAGFTDIRRRAFNPSLDCADREWGTLYVDAVKSSH